MARELSLPERKAVVKPPEPTSEDKALAAAMNVLEESMKQTAMLAEGQREIAEKLSEIMVDSGKESYVFRVTKRDKEGKIVEAEIDCK